MGGEEADIEIDVSDRRLRCSASDLSPILSLGSVIHGTVGFFSSDWPMAYLVATVISCIGLLIGSITHMPHYEQLAKKSPSPAGSVVEPKMELVGRITGMADCQWGQGSGFRVQGSEILNPKSLVALGDKFALSSGLLEITYDTGAKVILQGPVTYEVESSQRRLSVGGQADGKGGKEGGRRRAEGGRRGGGRNQSNPQSLIPLHYPLSTIHYPLFSVRTPTATVTDLGTEFGVEVDESGVTGSHVFQGSVKVQLSPAAGEKEGRVVLLGENEAVQIEKPSINIAGGDRRGVVHYTYMAASPERFARKLPARKKSLPVQMLVHFRLGEDDPGAVAGEPAGKQTLNHNRNRYQCLDKHGAPSYTADTAAPGSSLAMNFTGAAGEYFSSPHGYPVIGDYFILEAWARVNRLEDHPQLIAYSGHTAHDGYGLLVRDDEWQYMFGGIYWGLGIPCEVGKWTHLALVCERGKTQFWVDGRAVGKPHDGIPNIPDGSFAIGGTPNNPPQSFNGQIDEVRLSTFLAPFQPEMLLWKSVPGLRLPSDKVGQPGTSEKPAQRREKGQPPAAGKGGML